MRVKTRSSWYYVRKNKEGVNIMNNIIGSRNKDYSRLALEVEDAVARAISRTGCQVIDVEILGHALHVTLRPNVLGSGFDIIVLDSTTGREVTHHAPEYDADTFTYVIWRGIVAVLM